MANQQRTPGLLKGVCALSFCAVFIGGGAGRVCAEDIEIALPTLDADTSKAQASSLFPDDSLKPIEAPASVHKLLQPIPTDAAVQVRQVDLNAGPRADEAKARGHDYFAYGTKLLVPDKKEDIVETPFGELHIAHDSVVLLVCNASSLAVLDLHDDRKNAIFIEYEGKKLNLRPGYAMIVAHASETDFREVNPAPFVQYRGVMMSHERLPEKNVFEAEFHIASLISSFPALKALSNSPDPARRKVMSNMLKTAAIMAMVSQRTENYQPYISKRLLDQLNARTK